MGRFFVFTAIVGLCYFGYLLGVGFNDWFSSKPQLPNGGLVVDPKYLDFGEVWETDEFKWNLPLRNSSDNEVALLGFDSSCNCTSIKPASLILSPGEQKWIELIIDLRSTSTVTTPQISREFVFSIAPRWEVLESTGSCSIASADCARLASSQRGWQISGRVRRAFDAIPHFLYVEEVKQVNAGFPVNHVKLSPLHPINTLEVECDPALANATVRQMPSGAFELGIQLCDDTGPGSIDFDVKLLPNPEDPDATPIMYKVLGKVLDHVEIIPQRIDLGVQSVGQVVRESVVVKSTLDRSLTVENNTINVEMPGGKAMLAELRDSGPDIKGLCYEQEITTLGFTKGQLILKVSHDGKEVHQLEIPVSYYGVADRSP